MSIVDRALAVRAFDLGTAIDWREIRPNIRAMTSEQRVAFAKRLRDRRVELRLNTVAFCAKAHISRTTLRNLENGSQTPESETLTKLALALELPEDVLTSSKGLDTDDPLLRDIMRARNPREALRIAWDFVIATTDVRQRILAALHEREQATGDPAAEGTRPGATEARLLQIAERLAANQERLEAAIAGVAAMLAAERLAHVEQLDAVMDKFLVQLEATEPTRPSKQTGTKGRSGRTKP